MKKIFSFLMLLCFSLMLVSCGKEAVPAKISYVDPSTGEDKVATISPTNDKEAVLNALNLVTANVKEVTTDVKAELKMDMSMEMTASGQGTTMSIVTDMNVNYDMYMSETDGIYACGEMQNISTYMGMKSTTTSTMKMYTDDLYAYTHTMTKNSMFGQTEEEETKVYSPLDDVLGENDMTNMFDFNNVVKDKSNDTIVEEYEVSISNTTAKTIEFKIVMDLADLENMEGLEDTGMDITEFPADTKVAYYITYNVETCLPVSAKFDFNNFMNAYVNLAAAEMKDQGAETASGKGKLIMTLNMSYGDYDIKKLPEDQKSEYELGSSDSFIEFM